MPLSPQIVITPDDIVTKNFDISAVTYTSSTATYTATGHTFSTGNVVLVSGIVPDGYNGTFTITSTATNTFTVANTTNTAVTDPVGNAFWTDPAEYDYQDLTAVFQTDNNDLADPAVNPAFAAADAAAIAAAAAQADAATAYATAVAANTAASTAQSTANGKNKVTYSTTTPGSTANTAGDIWYQHGTSGVNNGRMIAQYMGAGGSSWTHTPVSGLVVANIDAGNITTGTLSVALGITGSAGNFSVNAVTGELVATKATITGAVNGISGYFGSLTNGYSISSTGLVGVGSGTIATSSGSNSVVLDGSQNGIGIKYSGSYVGWISSIATAGIVLNYGTTPDVGAYPQSRITSGAMTVSGTSSSGFSANSNGTNGITGATTHYNAATFSNVVNLNSQVNYSGISTGSGSTMVLVSTGSRVAYTTSSERFKDHIQYIDSAGWLDKVLELRPITYKTSEDFITEGEPNPTQIGLLAEDLADLNNELDLAVVRDPLGDPFSISYERLTPYLILAIKELNAKIQILEGK